MATKVLSMEMNVAKLQQAIDERFKYAATSLADRSQQWKQGLLSDDELMYAVNELAHAHAHRKAVKQALGKVEYLSKFYGFGQAI